MCNPPSITKTSVSGMLLLSDLCCQCVYMCILYVLDVCCVFVCILYVRACVFWILVQCKDLCFHSVMSWRLVSCWGCQKQVIPSAYTVCNSPQWKRRLLLHDTFGFVPYTGSHALNGGFLLDMCCRFSIKKLTEDFSPGARKFAPHFSPQRKKKKKNNCELMLQNCCEVLVMVCVCGTVSVEAWQDQNSSVLVLSDTPGFSLHRSTQQHGCK